MIIEHQTRKATASGLIFAGRRIPAMTRSPWPDRCTGDAIDGQLSARDMRDAPHCVKARAGHCTLVAAIRWKDDEDRKTVSEPSKDHGATLG